MSPSWTFEYANLYWIPAAGIASNRQILPARSLYGVRGAHELVGPSPKVEVVHGRTTLLKLLDGGGAAVPCEREASILSARPTMTSHSHFRSGIACPRPQLLHPCSVLRMGAGPRQKRGGGLRPPQLGNSENGRQRCSL